MFESVLNRDDAHRATEALRRMSDRGLEFAITGSLALDAQLAVNGVPGSRRALHDIDIVVRDVVSLPDGLADGLLVNHAHPRATEGKLVLQLVDPGLRLRIDVFRAFGETLQRAMRLEDETGDMTVVAIEDLRARFTAHVIASLGRGLEIDRKYVASFRRLQRRGEPAKLDRAWRDHRQDFAGSIAQATEEAQGLIVRRPELLVDEHYGPQSEPCVRCAAFGTFRLADPDDVLAILGYI